MGEEVRPRRRGSFDDPSGRGHFGFVFAVYVAVRAVLIVATLLSAKVTQASSWISPFVAWDGQWYVTVAQSWYNPGGRIAPTTAYASGGFEPAWPFLIHLGAMSGLSFQMAAFLLSLGVGVLASYFVWKLAGELLGRELAASAAIAALVFPGAAVMFGMAYSEVLGIGCVAAALYFLRRGSWLTVGVSALLATATSSLAVVVVIPILWEAGKAIRRGQYRAIAAVVLAPLGFLGYVAYLGYLAHDPFYWWKLQGRAWGAKIDPAFIFHWITSTSGSGWGMYPIALAGLLAVIVLLALVVLSGMELSIKLYCFSVALMVLVNPALGPKPRFILWMFPALFLLPAILGPRWARIAAMFSVALVPVLFIAYTTIGNTVAQP